MIRNLLLLSNSTMPNHEPLQHAASEISSFLKRFSVSEILFIPYALKDHDDYSSKMQPSISSLGYKLKGIHTFPSPIEAVKSAQAIFIGGGNTFRLLKTLYDHNLIEAIRQRVLLDGIPYMGSSAGTNVSTVSICTTNDMPIVYPPSFKALGLVPFNVNPHYIDPDPSSTHMGETRETRINQYHEEEDSESVLALREGSMLMVIGEKAVLLGKPNARVFFKCKPPEEYCSGDDLSFLLKS